MEQQQQPRKYVLRTTCSKNGGFQKYQPLPPQEVFQHAYWVLGSEMDVMIMRKQTLFNRKTDWMFLPVYLTTNKGLIFVYITNDSGYILRVASALKLSFEGTKKLKKQRKRRQPTEPDFSYDATIILYFQFGELRLRFKNGENLRPWRTILLAAHQSQFGITKIGESVAKELFASTSLESVVSTKSVYPEAGDKDKAEKVEIHRHPMVAPPLLPPRNDVVGEEERFDCGLISRRIDIGDVDERFTSRPVVPPRRSNIGDFEESFAASASKTSVTTSSVQSPLWTKSATQSPPKQLNDQSISASSVNDPNDLGDIGGESNESAFGLDVCVSNSPYNPFSPAPKTSKSHLTSEVNVSFEDLEPLSAASITAASSTCSRPPYPISLNHSPTQYQAQPFQNFEAESNESILDQEMQAPLPPVLKTTKNVSFLEPVADAPITLKPVSDAPITPKPLSAASITAASSTCSRPPYPISLNHSPTQYQAQPFQNLGHVQRCKQLLFRQGMPTVPTSAPKREIVMIEEESKGHSESHI